jgi:hypothetical protein
MLEFQKFTQLMHDSYLEDVMIKINEIQDVHYFQNGYYFQNGCYVVYALKAL